MSKRHKWVVFPDGAAGLRRIVLADDRSGVVLTVARDGSGDEIRRNALSIGFLPVPGSGSMLHFVPRIGNPLPFTIPQLARALGGKVSDISDDDMISRTLRAKGAPLAESVSQPVETDVVPVRPERVGQNSAGEMVLSAENGRFVRVIIGDEERFIPEPETGSRARFLRATSRDDLTAIAGAVFREVSQSFSGARMDQMIRFAMEPRNDTETPEFTYEEARSVIRTDLIKQLLEDAALNDASRGAWHDASRKATWMNNAVANDTAPGQDLTPSLHLMMLLHRLTRKHNSVDLMGSSDLGLAVSGRRESESPLTVLDLTSVQEGQRVSYVLNRNSRRADKGRTVIILPGTPETDEAMAIRTELGMSYGVESVISLPHNIADGTAGFTEWTMMVFGDKRPEALPSLPMAALRTMKAVEPDDLLAFEREVNRSVERLREFNSGEEKIVEDREEVKANDHQVPYAAMSRVSEPETMIPYALQGAVTIAQSKVMRHMEETGGVDATVASAMGTSIGDLGEIMSAEQVDTVAFWLYSRDRDMKGMACFDGTGVGKTRPNLAIGQCFLRLPKPESGKDRKMFYVTESTMNIAEIVDELHKMGLGHLRVGCMTSSFSSEIRVMGDDGKHRKMVVGAMSKKERDAVLESGKFPDEFDIVISTFSMMNRYGEDVPMTQWLNSAFGDHVMVALDEAHNAINVKSNTGKNIRIIKDAVPNNQFYSATATPAKSSEEIMAYDYLLPASAGDPQQIMEAVVKGREAAQEAFQTMLTQDASVIRRTRSLSSVNFKAHLPDDEQLANNQRVMAVFSDLATRMVDQSTMIANRMNQIVQDNILQNRLAGHEDGVAVRMANRINQNTGGFGGALSQLTNMIMVGLRIEGIYPQIRRDIEAGMKPVVSFEHTMMGLFDEADPDEDISGMTMRDQIKRVLDRSYTVLVGGDKVDIRDLDPEIAAAHDDILRMIDQFPAMPASPIDWLMDRLEEDGIRCGELTGRSIRYSNGRVVKRTKEERDKRRVVNAFNSGEVDALFHNKTGATGVSFHAHKSFLDQRPRSTYIVAAFSEVIKMLQGFGRTDRKEQTSNPTINWVMTGLIAETRAFQQINRRLRQLGASVDANRNHPMLIAEVPDLLNKVGDRAFLNVLRNRPEIAQRLDVVGLMGGREEVNVLDDREDAISATSIANLANTCMARMVILRDEEQNRLMYSVQMEFDALIEELDARNANPLKPKMIDGEIEITSQIIYQGEEKSEDEIDRSAFLDPLYLCTGIQRIEGRTPTGDDVVARVERCRRLQGTDGLEVWANNLRAAMPQVLRRYVPEGMNYEGAVLNPQGAGEGFRKRYETIDRMARMMERIKPGVTVRMPMLDDLFDVPNAYVIVDIQPPKNPLEAASPAGYRVTMIAAGEVNERVVSLKRMMDLPEEDVVFHVGLSRGDNPDLRRAFDETAGDVFERPVQVLNGNLLKAIVTSITHNLGTPCLYRDANSGQMMKGIVITDKKLDLRRLPVDLREQKVAEVLLDRRKDPNAGSALIRLYGSPSDQKNEYSVKEPAFFISGTDRTITFGYTLNKSSYPFFKAREEMYRALTGQPLIDYKNVRSSRTPRLVRISYGSEGAEERIKIIMDGMFRRDSADDSVNMNFFVPGAFREEINDIIRTRSDTPLSPVKEMKPEAPKEETAVAPEPVKPDEGVVEITGEEDFEWEM